jgi:hypothetical protein
METAIRSISLFDAISDGKPLALFLKLRRASATLPISRRNSRAAARVAQLISQ